MEITKKKVVKSVFYYKDIQDIFEYGEATFGEKFALSFFDEVLMDTQNLESRYYFIQNAGISRLNLKNTAI
jgi:toxin ParE1/3/4